jgi:phosphoribosyl 1,2-cyclic phosphodiesterase
MNVKVWGCRGSLPTPGATTLRYGGESTSIEIRSRSGQCIAVDAGSGIRKMGLAVVNDPNVSHISLLVTHTHWDHLMGFPFFAPAFDPRFSIAVCGGPRGQRSIWDYLSHQLEAPYFPVNQAALKATFSLGCACDRAVCDHCLPTGDRSIQCHSIPLNHPNGGFGFKFIGDGTTFVFLTDNELRFHHEKGPSRDVFVNECRGADLLFHDAQYTEDEYSYKRGWGHSTFADAVELAMEAGVKRLGLFHHDPDRSDDEIDLEVERCRERITKAGSSLECFACADGMLLEV